MYECVVYMKSIGDGLKEIGEDRCLRCVKCAVLESDHSPISLQLKLCEGRECKEVFGGVSSRDVNMSAPSRL